MAASEIAQDRLDYLAEPSQGILASVDRYVNESIHTLVFDGFSTLVSTYSFAISTVLTIYIVTYGIAAYRGLIQRTVEELFNAVFRLILVATLIFNYGEFLEFIYSALIVWPDEIAATLLQVISGKTAGSAATHVNNAMDMFFDQGFKLGEMVFYEGSLGNPIAWLWGFLIFIATFVLGVIPLGMVLTSKVIVAVLLSLTVLFLLFLLFGKTTGFFEGWVRNIMTMVFLKLLAFSIMAFSLLILKKPFAALITNQANDVFVLPNLLAVLVIAFVTWMAYKQIGSVASGLGSGFALQTTGVYEKNLKPNATKAMNAIAKQLRQRYGKK